MRSHARSVVARNGRLYSVCGGKPRLAGRERRLAWISGAAVVMMLAFSLFALAFKPEPPDGVQHRLPLVQVAHYTAEDFFSSAR